MARDTRQAFFELADKLSPQVRRAFEQAIADVRSAAQRRAIEAAIERGDIEGVIQAIRLGEEFFAPLDRQIEEAFIQGGAYQLDSVPKPVRQGPSGPLVIRFNGRSPGAQQWIRENGASLIQGVRDDQRDAIRETVSEQLSSGTNPRTAAREIAGKRVNGSRKGGILGLSSQQASYVQTMRRELADPDRMENYFTRKRRDKRLDGMVRKAQREGRALTDSEIENATRRYSERLLKLRSETIARTESISSLNAGRLEGIRQMIERGVISEEDVQFVWNATMDDRTRDLHVGMNGQVRQFGEMFEGPAGVQLRYPGDPNAPARHTINCRCYMQPDIDWLAQAV